MNCPKCGEPADERAVYCSKCGERLDEARAGASDPAERVREALSPPAAPAGDPTAREKEVLWEGRYSFRAMLGQAVLTALLTVAAIVLAAMVGRSLGWWIALGVVLLLWLYLGAAYLARRLGHHYRLTPRIFFHESGILVRTVDRIELIRIDDISMTRTIFERMVGVGTIRIHSDDPSHPELFLRGIADVEAAVEKIDTARREERRTRAVHIENL